MQIGYATHVYENEDQATEYIRRFTVLPRVVVRGAKCAIRDSLLEARECLWGVSRDPNLLLRKSLEAERLVFKSLFGGPDMLKAVDVPKKHK